MIVAELTGTAQRYARWDEPDEETTAAAVAELREIADGRAEVAGVQLGTKEGTPEEPRARNAAAFVKGRGQARRRVYVCRGTLTGRGCLATTDGHVALVG